MTKKKQKERIQIEGKDITSIRTIGSMFNQNSLVVVMADGRGDIRMPTSTVLKMVNNFYFTGTKARKYFYLDEAHIDD